MDTISLFLCVFFVVTILIYLALEEQHTLTGFLVFKRAFATVHFCVSCTALRTLAG